jgi:hypothetical protein
MSDRLYESDRYNSMNSPIIDTRYDRMNNIESPEQGANPLLILLAFIIVGTIIYFAYMYMAERKANADAAREKKELNEAVMRDNIEVSGYMEIAKQAKQAGLLDK